MLYLYADTVAYHCNRTGPKGTAEIGWKGKSVRLPRRGGIVLVDVVQEREARGKRKEKGNSEAVRAGKIVIGTRVFTSPHVLPVIL